MKRKTLILTAALALAGASTTIAQVFSENVVGYVNVDLAAGFNMIANPLNSGDNSIGDVIPSAPGGTLLYKFSGGSFEDANEFFEGFGWVQAGAASTTTLNPGEGVFIQLPSATTLTFVGEVAQGQLSTPIPAGFSILASQVPQAGTLTDLAYPAAGGDLVYKFDSVAQNYEDAYEFFDGFGWVQAGAAAEPNLSVAESFFSSKAAAASWDRDFAVN